MFYLYHQWTFRSIANMGEVITVLERDLMVVPKVMTSGSGHLCEQACIFVLTNVYSIYFQHDFI
jgi:hypothetical protein